MRRLELGALALVLTWFALLTWREAAAQEKGPITPAAHVVPARDVKSWPPARQQCYVAAQRATDWLRRTNRTDGRFVYGFLPALCTPMEGDDYVRQVAAAGVLARAARYLGDDASTAIARQALLTLLLETTADPQDAQKRYTAAPPNLVHRLAGNGTLLLAIHSLTKPGQDLLDQGDQLAAYLRTWQRPDGALQMPGVPEGSAGAESVEAAGLALTGISRSGRLRPAAWQPALLARARDHYLARWQRDKDVGLAVRHTPAYAEAYLQTKDPAHAGAVFAFNDWLCGLQYTVGQAAPRAWAGGFPTGEHGQPARVAPDYRCAACAESLAEACRVARAAQDLPRYERYGRALEACLQFLLTLQYSPARTRHFAEEFRPAVLGAFHASAQDGNLRLDYTQEPLSALVAYLEE